MDLPQDIDEYIKESIEHTLGLPVSRHTLEMKLSASEEACHRLRQQCLFLQSRLKERDDVIDRTRVRKGFFFFSRNKGSNLSAFQFSWDVISGFECNSWLSKIGFSFSSFGEFGWPDCRGECFTIFMSMIFVIHLHSFTCPYLCDMTNYFSLVRSELGINGSFIILCE